MRLFLALSLISILLAAGCTQGKPEAGNVTSDNGSIKIGIILPLTGTLANVGAGMKDSALLAVEDANAKGGVNGRKIELVIEDTSCDSAKAIPALNKMITRDKIVALIGGTCSGESLAIAPILNQNKLPAISPSASESGLREKGGDYFFRIVPSDAFQAKVAARYAKETLNVTKVAILYQNDEWGVGLRDEFLKEFPEEFGYVINSESFDKGATDMRTQIAKLKSSEPEMIYLPCYPSECAVALRQLSEAGFTGRILGADGGDDAATLRTLGAAADGFTITVASPSTGGSFNGKFRAKYGRDSTVYTAHVYDALMLLANAAKNGTSGPMIRDNLYGVFNYVGQSGVISFDKDGEITSAVYDVKEFRGGNFTILKKINV